MHFIISWIQRQLPHSSSLATSYTIVWSTVFNSILSFEWSFRLTGMFCYYNSFLNANLTHMLFHICGGVSSGQTSRAGISGSKGKCIYNFVKYHQIPSRGVVVILHSHQKCTKVTEFPQP